MRMYAEKLDGEQYVDQAFHTTSTASQARYDVSHFDKIHPRAK